jgi:hypothetical protein
MMSREDVLKVADLLELAEGRGIEQARNVFVSQDCGRLCATAAIYAVVKGVAPRGWDDFIGADEIRKELYIATDIDFSQESGDTMLFHRLITMNDSGWTFERIARVLREEAETCQNM